MDRASDKTRQVVDAVRREGVLRPRDLDALGISRVYLQRLVRNGELRRVGRGLYTLAGAEPTEHRSLAEACKRVPQGVLCLLSALEFHGLTSQMPFEVWMALGKNARRPRVDRPAMRFVRFSGPAFEDGIERHQLENVEVKVYGPEKTVADCFKFRNKIGLDVAIEALRDCLRERKCSRSALWEFAQICRVANVMKPYLEALT